MGAMVAVYLVFEMLWILKEIVCSREVVEVGYVWDKNISPGPRRDTYTQRPQRIEPAGLILTWTQSKGQWIARTERQRLPR